MAEARSVIACRCEQELQIGTGQFRARATEHLRAGDTECEGTLSSRNKPYCLNGQPNAQVVINWATPDSAPNKPDGQDVFKHDPRATIDTGAPAARIVGITADRVAVLVSAPEPAVVVYDETGAETSRTPVVCRPPTTAARTAADITPRTTLRRRRSRVPDRMM